MTKKIPYLIVTSFLILVVLVTPVLAQQNFRTNEVVTLGKDEVINSDFFASGEKVILSGTVNGDVYLAGGNIVVEGTVNGDLLVAGGNINIDGTVTGDVRTAGGNINVSGIVSGNITALGGSINLAEGANISGSLVSAGGNIQVYAPLGKGATLAGGAITLANSVEGNTLFTGEDITLTSKASVNGDLIYYSQKQADVQQGATVSGQMVHNLPPRNHKIDAENAARGISFAWTTFSFICALIIGGLILLWGPNITRQKAETILTKPLQSLGIGFLTVILTPIVILILIVTLIGIPIAIALLVFYLLLLFFVKIFVSVAIGIKVLGYFKQKTNIFMTFIVGLVIYTFITLIPILGGLFSLVAVLIGVGAYVITDYSFYRTLRDKKLI